MLRVASTGPLNMVEFNITEGRGVIMAHFSVREEGHTTQEERPGHAPSTGVGGATELRQAVWEEPPPPTAPEIMDLPPPSYGRSILDENPNYDDIPSYDEVISNYAAFPGAKPNTIDSSV